MTPDRSAGKQTGLRPTKPPPESQPTIQAARYAGFVRQYGPSIDSPTPLGQRALSSRRSPAHAAPFVFRESPARSGHDAVPVIAPNPTIDSKHNPKPQSTRVDKRRLSALMNSIGFTERSQAHRPCKASTILKQTPTPAPMATAPPARSARIPQPHALSAAPGTGGSMRLLRRRIRRLQRGCHSPGALDDAWGPPGTTRMLSVVRGPVG
jgi:hypothetical protein